MKNWPDDPVNPNWSDDPNRPIYTGNIIDWWHVKNNDCNMCPCEYVDFSTDLTKWDIVRAKLWDKSLSVFYKNSNSVGVDSFLNIK